MSTTAAQEGSSVGCVLSACASFGSCHYVSVPVGGGDIQGLGILGGGGIPVE